MKRVIGFAVFFTAMGMVLSLLLPNTLTEIIIIPLMDVSFAVGAGAFNKANNNESGAGGLGGKMSPSAVLVIQNGKTKLVNVKNQDTIVKILDMIPDMIERIKEGKEGKMTEEEVVEILDKAE